MLVQLPAPVSDYVNPQNVSNICLCWKTEGDVRHDFLVKIVCADMTYICPADSHDAAVALRDKIAEDINSTCVWESKGART